MSRRAVGLCSICGGRVLTYDLWWGTTPPPLECESCGAVGAVGPVIPMRPKTATAQLRLIPVLPTTHWGLV